MIFVVGPPRSRTVVETRMVPSIHIGIRNFLEPVRSRIPFSAFPIGTTPGASMPAKCNALATFIPLPASSSPTESARFTAPG